MFNVELFNFINHGLQNPYFDYSMPFITHLGGFISLIAICLAVTILAIIFKKDYVKRMALLCLFSLLLAGLMAFILKNIFLEPRPFVTLDNVHLLITEDDPNSFPSGHTASAFSVLGVLMFKYKNKLLYVIILILCGLSVGFSRIYVGVHYPFDILAGMIIGLLSAYFTYKYEEKIRSLFLKILVRLRLKKA